MVVHFLLAFDTVKCRVIRPWRIHLLRNKKERFKEKALEKVRIEQVFQNKLAVPSRTNLKFIFLVVNNCISFIEINNLLSLNCQYAPQNTRTYFARLQNVGSNTRMFTVLTI